MTDTPSVPAGMKLVTKDEFFAALAADKRDIMPRLDHREFTTWETVGRAVWGWSTPGWANPGAPKSFAIRPTL